MTQPQPLVALVLSAFVAACGDDATAPADTSGSDTSATADTTDGPLAYAPCADEARVGRFLVARGEDLTTVSGRVLDGVVPANIREVVLSDGPCAVLVGRSLFCDPACGAGETCGEDGACITYPTSQDVGEVTLDGLAAPLTLTASSSRYYSNGATAIPLPPWPDDAALALTATGGDVGAFSLAGRGVPALEVPTDAVPFERDSDATVTWTAADSDARVRLVFDLAHHGGIAASIVCDDLPDSGSHTVPASLVNRLLDEGVAGFPIVNISRQTADSTQLGVGCVDLVVSAAVDRDVSVPGVISCADEDACPTGTTCQDDLTCQ